MYFWRNFLIATINCVHFNLFKIYNFAHTPAIGLISLKGVSIFSNTTNLEQPKSQNREAQASVRRAWPSCIDGTELFAGSWKIFAFFEINFVPNYQ